MLLSVVFRKIEKKGGLPLALLGLSDVCLLEVQRARARIDGIFIDCLLFAAMVHFADIIDDLIIHETRMPRGGYAHRTSYHNTFNSIRYILNNIFKTTTLT